MPYYTGGKTLLIPSSTEWDLSKKEDKQQLIDILEELLRRQHDLAVAATGSQVRQAKITSAPAANGTTYSARLLNAAGDVEGDVLTINTFMYGMSQFDEGLLQLANADIIPVFKDPKNNLWYSLVHLFGKQLIYNLFSCE